MQKPIHKHPARKAADKQITNKFQLPISNDPNRLEMSVLGDPVRV